MCQFFSFITDGMGNPYYFNHEQRKERGFNNECDSHSYIAEYFKPNKFDKRTERADDVVNKYEYNPFTKKFVIDQINILGDSKQAEKWIRKLDFSIIEPRIDFNKSFKEPLEIKHGKEVSEFEINLLREWYQLGNLLREPLKWQLRDQLGYPLRGQLGDQLWVQLGDQLGDLLGDQLWKQIGDQLWDQLGYQFKDQLRNQLWGQLYSFATTFVKDFKFKDKKQEDLVNCINSLWSYGLMPFKVGNKLCLYTLNTCEKIYEEKICKK